MKFKVLSESSFKFYTNGEKTIKVKDGDEIPDGYYPGRTFNSNPWNKGLTAETSDKVKQNGQATKETRQKNGSYENPWNKGRTKETDERVKNIASKTSASMKGNTPWNKGVPASEHQKQAQSQAMKGKTPYNKGLTKETCQSLANASQKLMGHPSFVKDWDLAKKKEYETKKANRTFNTS